MFPQEVAALIENAASQRFAVGQDAEEVDRIYMTDEWASLLEQFPCKPARKGKMIHLLKYKSKKIVGMKPKKTYEPLDIIGQINSKKPLQSQQSQPVLQGFSMAAASESNVPSVSQLKKIKPKLMKDNEGIPKPQ